MKTAINGKIRLKWFWRGMYLGRGMTPIERIFTIGKLVLAKVVYAKYDNRDKRYYKADILALLNEYYEVRWEKMTCQSGDSNDYWHSVYSKIDSSYVGRPEEAYKLAQQGIRDVQRAYPKDNVSSIGFSPSEQKWYGWSHRAKYGFEIGDTVKLGDCCTSSGYTDEWLKDHPEDDKSLPIGYEAKTLDDAKLMAMAFAESLG